MEFFLEKVQDPDIFRRLDFRRRAIFLVRLLLIIMSVILLYSITSLFGKNLLEMILEMLGIYSVLIAILFCLKFTGNVKITGFFCSFAFIILTYFTIQSPIGAIS